VSSSPRVDHPQGRRSSLTVLLPLCSLSTCLYHHRDGQISRALVRLQGKLRRTTPCHRHLDTGEAREQTLVSACKVCARFDHRGLRRRRFPASPSSDDLGEPLPYETLAGVAPCARMQTTVRTTAICHRLAPNRMARTRPYPFGHPGWPASRLGWIWPRSGLAWPDPACLLCFFFFVLFNC
jgi:hypothetical protein